MELAKSGPDDLRPALRAAYDAGRTAHPTVELGVDAFAERLLAAVEARGRGDRLAQLIEETPAGDFYLASGCELDCAGAWDRLAEVCGPRVRIMALNWGASPADAEEIAAGLPGELLQPPGHGRHSTLLGAYGGAGNLMAWIGRVVDRRLVDRSRRRQPAADDRLDVKPAPDSGPSDTIIHTETGQRVARAFETAVTELAPRDFEILVLIYRDGVPQKEIAERLDVTPARISFLVKRALTRVRNSVLQAVPDETSAYWLDREGQALVLKDVIARILEKER